MKRPYFLFKGLMGKTNMETFRIEELHESIVEYFQSMAKVHFEQDEAKKVLSDFEIKNRRFV